MILTSVIIILREVLEASLLMSLLLALSYRLELSRRWALPALILGCLGAWLFAEMLAPISDWFDGTGQEVVNASLHFLIGLSLITVAFLWLRGRDVRQLRLFMVFAVALAIVREGSEIWLYYSGFFSEPDQLAGPTLGGAIGLGTGLSIGAILYYTLVLIPLTSFRWLSSLLFALVAAGMSSQGLNLLIQADYLPATAPVWDTSALLPEASVTGHLLYALLGYEAQPTLVEVVVYGLVLSITLLVTLTPVWRSGAPRWQSLREKTR